MKNFTDWAQKVLEGYGLIVVQIPFFLMAICDFSPEEIAFFENNYQWFLAGAYTLLGGNSLKKYHEKARQQKKTGD